MGNCQSVGNEVGYTKTCSFKVGATSAALLAISIVAVAIILALSQTSPQTFVTIGGYPLLGSVSGLAGVALVALLICGICMYRGKQTKETKQKALDSDDSSGPDDKWRNSHSYSRGFTPSTATDTEDSSSESDNNQGRAAPAAQRSSAKHVNPKGKEKDKRSTSRKGERTSIKVPDLSPDEFIGYTLDEFRKRARMKDRDDKIKWARLQGKNVSGQPTNILCLKTLFSDPFVGRNANNLGNRIPYIELREKIDSDTQDYSLYSYMDYLTTDLQEEELSHCLDGIEIFLREPEAFFATPLSELKKLESVRHPYAHYILSLIIEKGIFYRQENPFARTNESQDTIGSIFNLKGEELKQVVLSPGYPLALNNWLDCAQLRELFNNPEGIDQPKVFFGACFSSSVNTWNAPRIRDLGVRQLNLIMARAHPQALLFIPLKLFQDPTLDLAQLSRRTLNELFQTVYQEQTIKERTRCHQLARQRMRLIPPENINALIPKLRGEHLTLLSKKQLRVLDAECLGTYQPTSRSFQDHVGHSKQDQIEQMFKEIEDSPAEEKDRLSKKLFECLGVKKINSMIEYIPTWYVKFMLEAYPKNRDLALHKSPCLSNLFSSGSAYDLQSNRKILDRIHPKTLLALIEDLPGSALAALTKQEWAQIDISRIETSQIVDMFKAATTKDTNPTALFERIGFDKVNQIIKDIPLKSLLFMPKNFFANKELRLEKRSCADFKTAFPFSINHTGFAQESYDKSKARIGPIHPAVVGRMAVKLEPAVIALLTEQQLKAIKDWEALDIKGIFLAAQHIADYTSDDSLGKLFAALGIEGVKAHLSEIPVQFLRLMPDHFYKDQGLRAHLIRQLEDPNLFFTLPPTYEYGGKEDYQRSERLMGFFEMEEIHQLAEKGKLNGNRLILLSPARLGKLDVDRLNNAQAKEMFEKANNHYLNDTPGFEKFLNNLGKENIGKLKKKDSLAYDHRLSRIRV